MFDDFMINTWIAATLVAAVAGVVGFFVVIRGASFAAHALPLSAFPGAAAANLLGVDPLLGLLVFSGLGVAGISQLARRGRRDVATALSLVMLLGLGALFLSRTTEYFQAVYALLFGEMLGVSSCGSRAGRRAQRRSRSRLIVVLFRPLLLSSVSPELGRSDGRVGPRDGGSVPRRGGARHGDGVAGCGRAAGVQPDGGSRLRCARADRPAAGCNAAFSRDWRS